MEKKIKVIILAAGYGTRLEKDIEDSTDQELKSKLGGIPKPLLPIAGKPLMTRWMEILENSENMFDLEVNVIVNQKHYDQYEEWRAEMKLRDKSLFHIKLINDGSFNNENRQGAIQAIRLGVHNGKGFSNFLVIAGDTLYFPDFNLKNIVEFFYEKCGTTILTCPVKEEDVSKRGIVEIDEETRRVNSFIEKPKPNETQSRLQCPAFYLFDQNSTSILEAFISETKNKPLVLRDAPGHFLAYLIPKAPVYAFAIEGRFDVGGLDTYLECNSAFSTFNGLYIK